MYLKPKSAEHGIDVPDEGAKEAAQKLANAKQCCVLMCHKSATGIIDHIEYVHPVKGAAPVPAPAPVVEAPARPGPRAVVPNAKTW